MPKTTRSSEPAAMVDQSIITEPVLGPTNHTATVRYIKTPRLARHQFILSDGHPVGIAVAGHGVPLVVIHGFSVEGTLYAQTLSRLVSMGFKVIAIDTAGHGGTAGLPSDGANIKAYAALLERILNDLGVERCVLAGHSMGGRLVTQVAATVPDRVIAAVLIDAIVGDTWDRMVYLFRIFPPLLAAVGGALLVDSVQVAPIFRDPRQALKLARLVAPTIVGHVIRPWSMLGPVFSILRTRSSRYALDQAHESGVPFFVLHGDRDFGVPLRTAEDTARRVDAPLVKIEGAGHSWLLRDPETLPAIIRELQEVGLGVATADALMEAGVNPQTASVAEIEDACLSADSPLRLMSPISRGTGTEIRLRQPSYRWTITEPGHQSSSG